MTLHLSSPLPAAVQLCPAGKPLPSHKRVSRNYFLCSDVPGIPSGFLPLPYPDQPRTPFIGKMSVASQNPSFQVIRISSHLQHINIMIRFHKQNIGSVNLLHQILIIISQICGDTCLLCHWTRKNNIPDPRHHAIPWKLLF